MPASIRFYYCCEAPPPAPKVEVALLQGLFCPFMCSDISSCELHFKSWPHNFSNIILLHIGQIQGKYHIRMILKLNIV
jgi:hypothetical protein